VGNIGRKIQGTEAKVHQGAINGRKTITLLPKGGSKSSPRKADRVEIQREERELIGLRKERGDLVDFKRRGIAHRKKVGERYRREDNSLGHFLSSYKGKNRGVKNSAGEMEGKGRAARATR